MNRYLALSSGLHVLAALFLLLLLAPSAKKASATYTIDFIGTGKVVATTGQEASSPAPAAPKAAVQAPAPDKSAVAKPETKTNKKAYASKSEITTKKQTKKAQPKAAPLAAPSVLDDEADAKAAGTGGAPPKKGNLPAATFKPILPTFRTRGTLPKCATRCGLNGKNGAPPGRNFPRWCPSPSRATGK